jgi:hypothetical protein
MLCSQLQFLQENLTALLAASDQQEQLEPLGIALVNDKEAMKALREQLQQRLAAASLELGKHVHEHGCAN